VIASLPRAEGRLNEPATVTTFLFTDIEGSTRLWEQDPERMRPALARHDAIARAAVESHRGTVVKMTGDGVHAAFSDPIDAVRATLQIQELLADPAQTHGMPLLVRCGLHAGIFERRDNDFFGTSVNRAARIMSAAHGGQMLLSRTVAEMVVGRLPNGVSLHDLGVVRLRDLASPEHVFQVVHPRLRKEFPVLRSLEGTPNNLPHQLTSFVGRARELAEIRTALAHTRLLTLVGMGGLGKTRLSLHVAADEMDAYPDGVWFVELAPLRDGRLVTQAIATVLGVKEEAGRPVAEAVINYVKDRRLLLVLDNCEHVLASCAELARWMLLGAPFVKVLASSREPLHVAGESTYPLDGLSVPLRSGAITPAAASECEAVRLFVDRANAAHPSFRITARNAAAVASICRRLDGIPLAIELAAARVRGIPVQEISRRLDDRFQLLTSRDTTTLPRQQTLRALIDWSYDLLSPSEQSLLRQLAVFAGGWTLEAAEAVCYCDEDNVPDLLSRLVEKSLVALDPESGRYRLLETVRQYAQDRSTELGEGDFARDRQLAFYVSLAEKAKPELQGPQHAAWLTRLDEELENILAAHAWADNAERGGELGLKLVTPIKLYWASRGVMELGHRLTVEALARGGAEARNQLRCKGLFDVGQLRYHMGRYDGARESLEESLAIARELGDKRVIAAVLQPLGMAALAQGQLVTAGDYLEEAVALAKERENKRELAAAYTALAQLRRVEGNAPAAMPLYEQVLRLARDLDDRESVAIALLDLIMVTKVPEPQRAKAMLREALEIAIELRSTRVEHSALDVGAGLAAAGRDWDRAARFYGAAEAQGEKTALRRDPADEAYLLPLIEMARQALGAQPFAAAESLGRALSHEDAMSETRAWLTSR
jgi:predicted ATPase/class 3 adenylate cyclase